MWTQDDEAIRALADYLAESHQALSRFLEAVWNASVKAHGEVPKSPGYAILFTLGKFSQAFEDRRATHAGEDVRDSLHMVMNHILQDPTTQALMGHLTGQAINGAVHNG